MTKSKNRENTDSLNHCKWQHNYEKLDSKWVYTGIDATNLLQGFVKDVGTRAVIPHNN